MLALACTSAPFHKHFCSTFSRTIRKGGVLLPNGVWQMANKFGKKCTNLSLKFGVLFVGEIDERIFCLAKKV